MLIDWPTFSSGNSCRVLGEGPST